MSAAPYTDAGWIILNNSKDGYIEETVDTILLRLGLSGN